MLTLPGMVPRLYLNSVKVIIYYHPNPINRVMEWFLHSTLFTKRGQCNENVLDCQRAGSVRQGFKLRCHNIVMRKGKSKQIRKWGNQKEIPIPKAKVGKN